MEQIKTLLLIGIIGVVALFITGCAYHEHYQGTETMIDEGVVVREHYVVE